MFVRLKNYFVAAYRELHKVTWLTRKQFISHTIICLCVTLVIAFYMAFFDKIFLSLNEFMHTGEWPPLFPG